LLFGCGCVTVYVAYVMGVECANCDWVGWSVRLVWVYYRVCITVCVNVTVLLSVCEFYCVCYSVYLCVTVCVTVCYCVC